MIVAYVQGTKVLYPIMLVEGGVPYCGCKGYEFRQKCKHVDAYIRGEGFLKGELFLHADKEQNWELGTRLGLTGEALRAFCFACTELKVEFLANRQTGMIIILAIDGVPQPGAPEVIDA